MQGGLTFTELFKARANPFLHKLGSHPHTFKIGCIPTGSILVADDLALISETNLGMQMLLKHNWLLSSQVRVERTRGALDMVKHTRRW